MNRFVLAEPKRCIGCNTCLAACSESHRKAGLQEHPRLTVIFTEDKTQPVMCRHCEDAPCARVCPVQAIKIEANAVRLDETICIGCKLCAIACPFGAIEPAGTLPIDIPKHFPQSIPETELAAVPMPVPGTTSLLRWQAGERCVAVKCDLCEFLPDGPECVRVCPTQALMLVDDASLNHSMKEKQCLSNCASFDSEMVLLTTESVTSVNVNTEKTE